MPQIGWFEILIIVSIAIVVVGPKDFPHMLKKIGSWIGSIKRYVSNVQDQVSNLENEKLKIYLSLIKFILITISKIKIGIDISANYLSANILKIKNVSNHISKYTIQRKLDYLINNENDLFTFNLDKKIFMINFIAEK